MIKSTIATTALLTTLIFTAANDFNQELPIPVQITNEKENVIRVKARYALEELGAPADRMNRLVNAVHAGHIASDGIDPILIASIISPESSFKIDGVSNKGYKSLMGTPKAVMKWEYAETNVVYGSQILRDKITAARGNVDKALVYYKGHGGPESQYYAKKQMQLYRTVRDKVNKKMKEEELKNG